jgi:hypothetical protein
MDFAQFPVASLLTLSGPQFPSFPSIPGEDYESWMAQLDEHTWVRVPISVIREMTTPHHSGHLWAVDYSEISDTEERRTLYVEEMERVRGELNAAAARVQEWNA